MPRRKNERNLASILAGASESFWRANPGLGTTLAGAKPESPEQLALEQERAHPQGMVKAPGRWLVRITRRGKRTLDHDNLLGGCKQLRDAIAEDFLGLKGDAEQDGVSFDYAQEISKTKKETLIEVWREER